MRVVARLRLCGRRLFLQSLRAGGLRGTQAGHVTACRSYTFRNVTFAPSVPSAVATRRRVISAAVAFELLLVNTHRSGKEEAAHVRAVGSTPHDEYDATGNDAMDRQLGRGDLAPPRLRGRGRHGRRASGERGVH